MHKGGHDMTGNEALRGLPTTPVAALPIPSERAEIRKQYGVTQAQLAAALRVSRKTIYTWEAGTAEPTGAKRDQYAAVLAAWQRYED
jgi:DNA-binding transcriptional regulator YiaG